MKQYTIMTYEFKELSEDAKQTALEKLHDINVDYNWWEFEVDYWKEKLEEIGFINPIINFTGFWSQGDGASFTSDIDLNNFTDNQDIIDVCEFKITRGTSNYYHEKTCYVNCYYDLHSDSPVLEEKISKLEKEIETLRCSLCKEIYNALETDYSYLTSKKAIIETIECNKYEFTSDGNLY